MKFKGTPGPWVASKTDRGIGPICKDDDQSYGMILPVAWVEFDERPGVHQANANLIAAAPDLIEALNSIMELQTRGYVVLGDKCTEMARAAIAKAIGEEE
ncbi:hypothetical protein AUM89_21550 [Cronobacter sakazakii]|nr:hypothetical protein [Cronobacter sakazakii]EGT4328203.1 hypothetical protein [Cronobacter sakazakii]EGT4365663.1 hypothetical protein [Cronobacter sakazakii]